VQSSVRGGSRTSNNHFTRDVLRADGTRAYVGYGVDSLTVGLVAVCRVKFAGESRDAVASLYPTAEEARITCAIVDAAARVRDLNFKYLAEGEGATVTARFGKDGITLCDPNRAVFRKQFPISNLGERSGADFDFCPAASFPSPQS